MASPLSIPFYLLFSCSLFLPVLSSSSTPGPVSLPLHRLSRLPPHPEPFQWLAGLANASVFRASLLKNPKSAAHPARAPVYPHSYGAYSLTLAFGTPPQNIPLILDTGSQLTWISCTPSYKCRRCASEASPTGPAATFLPKSSSSARLIGCRNPKCSWIHPPELLSRCKDCPSTDNSSSSGCPVVCPSYVITYGSGSTAGVLLSESLSFPGRTATNFAVGCSTYSDHQPAGGIAAFGRGAPSIPAQLGLRRFSYCLISRQFDDQAAESGSVVLDGARDSSADAVSFTPFLKNPSPSGSADDLSAFSVYYYVGLRKITVGGKKIKIPYPMLVPGPDGNGGTIVDSGTTFTYMESAVFDPVAAAFTDQLAGRLNRSTAVEALTGLRPCFSLPAAAAATETATAAMKKVDLPELVLHFKGGAEMRLPQENYFAVAGESRETAAVCLTIVSHSGVDRGPAIILGNVQQQNYYMVYDLERERLGFRRQSCVGS